MWEGSGCHVYSKVNHSVLGVNMQDISTLQDRLAVMLPLDTDLRSVCRVFFSLLGAKRKLILDLCLNSNLHNTSHRGGGYAEQTTGGRGERDRKDDRLEERHTVRQASGRTDGRSVARQGLLS